MGLLTLFFQVVTNFIRSFLSLMVAAHCWRTECGSNPVIVVEEDVV